MKTEQMMSVNDYAKWNGVSRSWIYTLIERRDKRILYDYIGGIIVILKGSKKIKG